MVRAFEGSQRTTPKFLVQTNDRHWISTFPMSDGGDPLPARILYHGEIMPTPIVIRISIPHPFDSRVRSVDVGSWAATEIKFHNPDRFVPAREIPCSGDKA